MKFQCCPRNGNALHLHELMKPEYLRFLIMQIAIKQMAICQHDAVGVIGRGKMNLNNLKTNNTIAINKSLITLAVISALSSVSSFATAKDNAEENMEQISVTATRTAVNVGYALSSQVIITRADIERIQPKSVLDLLANVSGVDISVQGGRGQASSVYIRGANAGHTLFLLDGLRISSATLGSTSVQTIAPELIERIEIVKGPRAALWGSDAIGGVVQIFTRKLEGGERYAGVTVGSDQYKQINAGLGFSHGNGQTGLSINYEESDGFDVKSDNETDDDGYDYLSVALKGHQQITQQFKVDWLFNADEGQNEYDSSFGANEGEVNNFSFLLKGAYQSINESSESLTSFSMGKNRDSKTSFGNGVSKSQGSTFETNRQQFSLLHNTVYSDELQLNVGIDHYNEKVTTDTAYAFTERDVTGVFGHSLYKVSNFTFEGAVRYDDVEHIDTEVTYNAGIGIDLDDISRVVLNYGTGFKAPSFNDLYYPEDAYGVGQPDLKAEYSSTKELLIESKLGAADFVLSLFQSDINDLIVWQPNTAKNDQPGFEYQWIPMNLSDVEISGIELSFNYEAFGGFHQVNTSYIDATDKATQKQLIRRAKEQFNYQFSKQIDNVNLSIDYQYHGKRYDSSDVQLDSYKLVNLATSYALTSQLEIQAKIKNLFNENYQTANRYNSQDRAFYLGISYSQF